MSITITVGFGCFFGIGYVVDSNILCGRFGRIIYCHCNHIVRFAVLDIRNNIRRFTQYAASCE